MRGRKKKRKEKKTFKSVLGPSKERKGIDIGIGSMNVGGSVVGIVLVLPPIHAESLENVSENVPI